MLNQSQCIWWNSPVLTQVYSLPIFLELLPNDVKHSGLSNLDWLLFNNPSQLDLLYPACHSKMLCCNKPWNDCYQDLKPLSNHQLLSQIISTFRMQILDCDRNPLYLAQVQLLMWSFKWLFHNLLFGHKRFLNCNMHRDSYHQVLLLLNNLRLLYQILQVYHKQNLD